MRGTYYFVDGNLCCFIKHLSYDVIQIWEKGIITKLTCVVCCVVLYYLTIVAWNPVEFVSL